MHAISELSAASVTADFTPSADWPDWFQFAQSQAWDDFQSLPTPTRKDETWRYSRLKVLDLSPFHLAKPIQDAASVIQRSNGLEATSGRLIFGNNVLLHKEATSLPEGVIFLPLHEAVVSHPDLVKEYFMREEVKLGSAKYAALHRAHVQNGTFLYVPKNTQVELPIEIFHWVEGENASVFPHTLIICEENSQVTLVDHFQSTDNLPAFACAISDLHLKQGAILHYGAVQEWSEETLAFHLNSTIVARDATAQGLSVQIGGSYIRTESLSRLEGEGGRSDMLSVCPAVGKQFFDQRTFQEHAKPHTTSDLLYLNALDDASQAIFSGLIRADEGSHFIDGYQKVRNLLLSSDAASYSLPGLEILADRVRCTHGATSGSINEEQLFYLRARGIPIEKARRLIALGFFQDVFRRVTLPALKEYLENLVTKKIG